ncbi:MAG: TolC family protein [Spirochaetes bacterium]|nr:TolC family protein [Spirochaetota bacterium]
MKRSRAACRAVTAILLAVSALSSPGSGATGDTGAFTLQDALTRSIKNNNQLLGAIEKSRESGYKVREVWGMLWPDLSTDVSITRMGAESGYAARLEGQYDIKIVNGTLAINPGVFYNSLNAARKGYIVAENDVRRVKAETTVQCIKLYYQTLMAGELVKLYTESVKLLEENMRVVTTGYQKGVLSKLDYLRAKVAHANERTKMINAQNDYRSAQAALNIHMGRDIHETLTLQETLEYHRDRATAAVENFTGDTARKERALIAIALKNRPELIQLKMKRDIEKDSAMAAASIYFWPSFFVTGNVGYSMNDTKEQSKSSELSNIAMLLNPSTASMGLMSSSMSSTLAPSGWNRSWSVTVGATYRWGALSPIESSHAKSKQLKSQSKQTEQQLEAFVKSVKLEVERGYLKLKSAEISIGAQQGNIEAAQESLRVARLQFRGGIIDNTKLLEANVQLITATTLYLQSLNDLQVAKADLNRAMGEDYYVIQ